MFIEGNTLASGSPNVVDAWCWHRNPPVGRSFQGATGFARDSWSISQPSLGTLLNLELEIVDEPVASVVDLGP